MGKAEQEEEVPRVEIRRRPAILQNVNYKPERHGSEWLPRVDLSIKFVLVDPHECDMFIPVAAGSASSTLWTEDGEPALTAASKIPLSSVIVGGLKISERKSRGMLKIETAWLKKISIEPLSETRATIYAQLRFDPTGVAERINQMAIDRECVIAFSGVFDVDSEPEENEEGDAKAQGRLAI